MKFELFLIIVCTTLFLSCTNDDDTTNVEQHPISGSWKLIDVTCECAPANFQADHIWNFDLSQNTLTVVNEQDENLQILNNGIYPFTLSTNTITIESVIYDYYFEGEILFLANEPEVDGPLMSFERE